jgi:oligoendopeptidase F
MIEESFMVDWNKIRVDVENFATEKEREWFLNWAGLKEEMNLSAIYEKYGHLFTKPLILEVKEKRKQAKGEEERKLRYLQEFFISGYLDTVTKELFDKAETLQAKEKIKVDSEEIPFRLAAIKISNEPDRTKRNKIFQARNKVIDKTINPVLKERMQKLRDTSVELGYKNYMELYESVKNIDFQNLEKIMHGFVDKTESLYVSLTDKALKDKLGISLKDAERHDLSYFFRAKEYDNYFKKEKAVETLKKTLANMGIRLDKQKNIEVDTEERPSKSPRAFCSGIKVPDEIKLVMMPHGGHDDYAALFHEAGHAEHFGCVNAGLDMEYKRLGDNSVTETFAFLLEYLLTNEKWLKQHTPMKDAKSYLNFLHLYKLFFLRRYAAKLSYEIKLHTSKTLEDMDKIYEATLDKVLKFKNGRTIYLLDVDDGFYCAQYLRAWIFEAQLRATLQKKFGEQWFNSPEAGKFLTKLWADGQKYDVIELAKQLGYSGLDIKPLLTSIQKQLS